MITPLNIITIDGPAGSGKSTIAKLVAERLGYAYLDSGALYRGLAWVLAKDKIAPVSGPALAKALQRLSLHVRREGHLWVPYFNDTNLSPYLRTPEVSQASSVYSALPEVRRALLSVQREAGEQGRLVCDGRDMGSVVFPAARTKIYLDASPEVRAKRRLNELVEKGQNAVYEDVLNEIKARDLRDQNRPHAPLAIPNGAFVLDTSGKSLAKVLEILLNFIDNPK